MLQIGGVVMMVRWGIREEVKSVRFYLVHSQEGGRAWIDDCLLWESFRFVSRDYWESIDQCFDD